MVVFLLVHNWFLKTAWFVSGFHMQNSGVQNVVRSRSDRRSHSVRILKPEAPKICELIFDFLVSSPAELALAIGLGLGARGEFLKRHGMAFMAFVLDGVVMV